MGEAPQLVHIAFACDDKYARHIPVVVRSITQSKQDDTRVAYYVLCADLSSKSRGMIAESVESVQFVEVEEEFFRDCPIFEPNQKCGHITLPTYFRFALAEILPMLSKVIYLDCDTIVNGPIEELWAIDLSDKYASVSPELGIQRFANNHHEELGIPSNQTYFNAGVMMLNLEVWRESQVGRQLFENVRLLNDRIKFVDQDVLNYTLGGNVLVLDERFNFQESGNEAGDRPVDFSYPLIVHFLGPDKPWDPGSTHGYRCRYLQYLNGWELSILKLKRILHFLYSKKAGSGAVDIRLLGVSIYKRRNRHDGQLRLEFTKVVTFKWRRDSDATLRVVGLRLYQRRLKNDGRLIIRLLKFIKFEQRARCVCDLKLMGLCVFKKRMRKCKESGNLKPQIRILGIRLLK